MITASVHEPIYKENPGAIIGTLSELAMYTHVISSFIGYDSAQVSFNTSKLDAEAWLTSGLGREIRALDATQIWEGFVDTIHVNFGATTLVKGPFLKIVNRSRVGYAELNTNTGSAPIVSSTKFTSNSNDTDSQETYGIRSSNTLLFSDAQSLSDAESARDTYIIRHKNPTKTQETTQNKRENVQVTLFLKGYGHWLNFPYINLVSGNQNLSDKLISVLSSEPNGAFADITNITSNTKQVSAWENVGYSGKSILKSLISLSNASSDRYIFGIYNQRTPFYEVAPTEVFYQERVFNKVKEIRSLQGGSKVDAQTVLPGRWIMWNDISSGVQVPSNSYQLLEASSSFMFIEKVRFTAPDKIELIGEKVNSLPDKLGQTYGLWGSRV